MVWDNEMMWCEEVDREFDKIKAKLFDRKYKNPKNPIKELQSQIVNI